MVRYQPSLSFSERRGSTFDNDLHLNTQKMPQVRPPRGPPTPSMTTPAADYDQQLSGSPPPPPTPAASPGPSRRQTNLSSDEALDDDNLDEIRDYFVDCSSSQRMRILAALLDRCTSQQ